MKKKNKVVINCCYGGYGLSITAVNWLAINGSEETKALIAAASDKEEAAWRLERLPRHNSDVVACVEALGKKASGECADLSVVTIDGNRYRIDEYDGAESIITPRMEHYIQI
jgi:hypothetical protein